jgi:YD repeat-containing protein
VPQDTHTNAAYKINPRVYDATVNDSDNNHRRTSVTFAAFGLPQEITEYAANTTTPLRTTRTEYNIPNLSEYHSRRIIGLPSLQLLYEGTSASGTLLSKVGFEYDDNTLPEGYLNSLPSAATQHDGANYGTGLRWRGNANRIRRYDVTGGASTYVESQASYNISGTVAFSKDAAGHKVAVSYADSFYQGVNRSNPALQTFAYPTTTTVTDVHLLTASAWYNYDMGVVTESETPLPNFADDRDGPKVTRLYDKAGRAIQVTNSFNAARTKWVYPDSMNLVQTRTLLEVDEGVEEEAYTFSLLDGAGRVRASARDMPGSNGGYSGQFFDYDSMGRLARQSNPTETTAAGSWPATGDDASPAGNGWVYTAQTYDWLGRPRITTNTNGTTKEASYSGCGCAGGEIITLTDEGNLSAGVTKKRQQKLYSDVLGRTVKTEVLNWQSGTVYSATVNTYNARDQVTSVKQYAGAATIDGSCPSGTCQETTTTYDGHARVETRHVPQQNAGTNTVWAYNDDDTVLKITDARGASQTFGYNGRHLMTGITYAAPAPIPTPSPVTYNYDAAGNRISMTDGMGSASYSYNQLSRMTAESRTFPGLGSLSLGYDYNLAGELKLITDPMNSTVHYSYDLAGRLNNVTGTNYGVPQFASGIQYRAWGAVKQAAYGDGTTLSLNYNQRLGVTHHEIPNIISIDYQYFNDGSLSYSHDVLDPRFDRSYARDHVGRLTRGRSGAEARGEPSTTDRPYWQNYVYDAFDHLTSRVTKHWSSQLYVSVDSYTNNRRVDWHYDAAGNLTDNLAIQYSYDAAGRMVFVSSGSLNQFFDGDGQRVKSTEPNDVTYYVRSSLLNGQVIAELDASGNRRRGFIYAGTELLAEQWQNGVVSFTHKDSSGTSVRGGFESHELDPLGAEAELEDPYPADPKYDGRDPGGPLFPGYGNITQPSTGCTLDGVYALCDWLSRGIENGSVEAEYPKRELDRTQPYDPRNQRKERRWGPVRRPIENHGLGLYEMWMLSEFMTEDANAGRILFVLPQNPGRNEKEITNCQRFAAAVDVIANNSQSETNFLDELARTFLRNTDGNPANSSIGEMRLGAGGVLAPGPASFLVNSGIRREFRGQSDEQGQIRHFVGAVIAASYGFFGREVMIQREEDTDAGRADAAVNRLAFSIYGEVTGPLGARGRIYQIKKRFADEIRRRFCE